MRTRPWFEVEAALGRLGCTTAFDYQTHVMIQHIESGRLARLPKMDIPGSYQEKMLRELKITGSRLEYLSALKSIDAKNLPS